jgi:hypothetical protein
MLEMKVDGDSLDLPENLEIEIIIENPFLLLDRIPLPYILTFSLDATPHNLAKLKYPNRITSSNTNTEVDCALYFSELNFLSGILAVVEFDKTINVSFRGISVLDNLKKKLWNIVMQQYSVFPAYINTVVPPERPRYSYRWTIDYTNPLNFGGDYKALAKRAANGLEDKWTAAPVRISGEDFQFSHSGAGDPIYSLGKSADYMYYNFFNPSTKDFVTEDADPATFPIRLMEHVSIFPYPYLSYVFNVLFSDVLLSNPFETGELSQLVVLSTFHENYTHEYWQVRFKEFAGMVFDNMNNQPGTFTPFFRLNSFMADVDANEFLKNIMKIFCFSIFPQSGKYKIIPNKDIIADLTKENWTKKLIGQPAISKQPGQGYKYGYEGVKDQTIAVNPENMLNTIKELIEYPVGEGNETFFYVKSTKEYFKKELRSGKEIYTLVASGLAGNEDVENPFDTTSAVAPLPMSVSEYWTLKTGGDPTTLDTHLWYVPQWTGDRSARDTKANIMFARGMKPTFVSGELYPLLTAINYDHLGNRLGDHSLAWEGDDGLINRHHKEFKLYIEKPKLKVSSEIDLTPADIKNLNLAKRKHIQGRDFFIEKLTLKFTKYQMLPTQGDFIEA